MINIYIFINTHINVMKIDIEKLEKLLPSVKKIVNSLIFKDVNVDISFSIVSVGVPSINVKINVDVDKTFKGSPDYDEQYSKKIKKSDSIIDEVSKLLGIPAHQIVVQYKYFNDNYLVDLCQNMTDEWLNILTHDYGMSWSDWNQYLFDISLHYDNTYISDLQIIAFCENIMQDDDLVYEKGLTCEVLSEMVDNIFDKFNLTESGFDHYNGVCADL